MRYSKIIYGDISNGEGAGVALFTQGCSNRCKGCFNESTWEFDGGKEFTDRELQEILEHNKKYDSYISRLSILGGEPLDNIELTTLVVKAFKKEFPNKKVWLWTGKRFSEITGKLEVLMLLKYVDILVDGSFVQELSDPNLRYRGSSNQRIINVQESLKQGKVMLWED